MDKKIFVVNRLNKGKIIIFTILSILAFVGKSTSVYTAFDISFTFSTIFIFLILMLFDFKSAMLVSVFVNIAWFPILGSRAVLEMLEILVVGISYTKFKKNILLLDFSYWVICGILHYVIDRSLNIEEHINVVSNIINGVLNSSFVNGIFLIIPLSKVKSLKISEKSEPTIFEYVINICIISILTPFVLFLIYNMMTYSKKIETVSSENFLIAKQKIEDQVTKMTTNEVRQLKDGSIIELGKIQEIIMDFTYLNRMDCVIFDQDRNIISTSFEDARTKQLIKNKLVISSGKIQKFIIYKDKSIINNVDWDKSFYYYSVKLFTFEVLFLLPMGSFKNEFYQNVVVNFTILLVVIIFSLSILLIVRGSIIRSISNLVKESTGLVDKIRINKNVNWPRSGIFEIKQLSNNFTLISEEFAHILNDNKMINQNLNDMTSELSDLEKKLSKMENYDVLTSLPNRKYFMKYLNEILDKNINNNSKYFFSIIFMDLDSLRSINEKNGYLIGDEVLKIIAERIKNTITYDYKNKSLISRLNGDEFSIIIEHEEDNYMESLVKELVNNVSQIISIEDKNINISFSVGVSQYPYNGVDMLSILRKAENAMYYAKEKGKGQVAFYKDIRFTKEIH